MGIFFCCQFALKRSANISSIFVIPLQTLLHSFNGWYVDIFSQVVLDVNPLPFMSMREHVVTYSSEACESMLSLTVQKHARACCHLQFRAWESMFQFLSVTCPGLLENDWLMYPGYKCTLYPMFDKDKCHWNM